MKLSGLIVALACAVILVSCGGNGHDASQLTATVHVKDAALAECDSAISAFQKTKRNRPDFNELKSIYDEYLQKYPNSTELWRSYQDMHARYKKNEVKAAESQQKYEANPGSAMYAYLYSRTLTDKGEKLSILKKATELDPDYYWGWYGLAVTQIGSPDPDTASAIGSLMRAIRIDNSQPAPFRAIGNVYEGRQDLDSALAFFTLLAQTEPDKSSSLIPKVETLTDMGRFEDAEKELAAFIRSHPRDKGAIDGMVNVFDKQGKFNQATPFIYRSIELSKRPGDGYYRLAVNFCNMNEPDSAMDAIEKYMGRGKGESRPVLYDPALAPLRTLDGYKKLESTILARQDSVRAERYSNRAKDRAERKKKALTQKLSRPAPDFTLTDLNGDVVTLSELKGDVVILDFWATWCGYCKRTMPLLQEFLDLRSSDVKYYAVNVWQRDTSDVRPYLLKYGYTFNSLYGSRETASEFDVSGIPSLFVIDREGNIRYKHGGYRNDLDEVLSWQVDDLLK